MLATATFRHQHCCGISPPGGGRFVAVRQCPTCRAHFCLNDVLPLDPDPPPATAATVGGGGAPRPPPHGEGGRLRLLTVGHGVSSDELFERLAVCHRRAAAGGGAPLAGLVDLRPSLQVCRPPTAAYRLLIAGC